MIKKIWIIAFLIELALVVLMWFVPELELVCVIGALILLAIAGFVGLTKMFAPPFEEEEVLLSKEDIERFFNNGDSDDE